MQWGWEQNAPKMTPSARSKTRPVTPRPKSRQSFLSRLEIDLESKGKR
jgi:hypothetical protein